MILLAAAALAVLFAWLALGYPPAGAVPVHRATAAVNDGVAKRPITVRIITDTQTVGRYVPRRIHLRLGQTFRFVNRSIDPHTVRADDGSFDSGYLGIGKHWTLVTTKGGPVRVSLYVSSCDGWHNHREPLACTCLASDSHARTGRQRAFPYRARLQPS